MLRTGSVLFIAVAAVVTAVAPLSHAQPSPGTGPHARATLVSEVTSFIPGQPFTVAIAFEIDPKWHLYYRDPGDSGLAPSVKWDLPEGLTAGELQFPKPEVLKTPAGVNFVYLDKAAILVQMTPDKNFKIGRAIEIAASLSWLECDADACVPAKQAVTVRVTADERVATTAKDQFDAWRAKVQEAESFDPAAAK